MSLNYYLKKIKDVSLEDVLSLFPMIISLLLLPFNKNKYSSTWLICEDKNEARDNGYWFYKYLCENQPNVKAVYAISSKSPDYDKVNRLGPTVEYGSVLHWIIYFSCKYNISSQKGGKPNAAVCAGLEAVGVSKTYNVFLQHGVTINNAKWLYADNSNISLFISATNQEYEYLKSNFGYPEGVIKYTGFPRFDNLQDFIEIPNQILVMPSWRAWFKEKTAQISKYDSDFIHSEYYVKWNAFLNSPILNELIQKYSLNVVFYPHRNMQEYLNEFAVSNNNIVLASANDYDVQELLKSSKMLITDYSSVFFDAVYMKKPLLFYQFDLNKFRSQQYEEGYFDYSNNPFGKSFVDEESVLKELERIILSDYSINEQYLVEHNRVFSLFDNLNSERIYSILNNQ